MPRLVNPPKVRAPLPRRVYSPDEVAEMFGLCRASIYNMMQEDVLPYVTIGGRRRVLVETVERLLAGAK